MLAVMPAGATDVKPVQQDPPPMLMEIAVGSFEEEVDSVSSKLRRLMWESRRESYGRQINNAIATRDPDAAQKALDGLVREYPELKKQEPHAIEYHQGNIAFWRGDLKSAYSEFDKAIKALEQEYPNGVPPGGQYSDMNASFLSGLYFSRGATQMHQGQFAKAILDMDKAISVSPKPIAYMQVNKCRALIALKKYKEATESFELAYKIDSQWAMNTKDKSLICETLAKNSFQPQPCLPPGKE